MPAIINQAASAVDRESAWLTTTGDGLPSLIGPDGPWDVVQGYLPRVAARRKTGIYVFRKSYQVTRFANIRSKVTHDFELRLVWQVSRQDGSAEADARAFDIAIDLLVQRVSGFLGDKTHGGRFLSVAESPNFISVEYEDPDVTIPAMAAFAATVSYSADDEENPN